MSSSMRLFALPLVGLIFMAIIQVGRGQGFAPAPAPANLPANDGAAIDQGIAYVLLLVALAITYLVH